MNNDGDTAGDISNVDTAVLVRIDSNIYDGDSTVTIALQH